MKYMISYVNTGSEPCSGSSRILKTIFHPFANLEKRRSSNSLESLCLLLLLLLRDAELGGEVLDRAGPLGGGNRMCVFGLFGFVNTCVLVVDDSTGGGTHDAFRSWPSVQRLS